MINNQDWEELRRYHIRWGEDNSQSPLFVWLRLDNEPGVITGYRRTSKTTARKLLQEGNPQLIDAHNTITKLKLRGVTVKNWLFDE